MENIMNARMSDMTATIVLMIMFSIVASVGLVLFVWLLNGSKTELSLAVAVPYLPSLAGIITMFILKAQGISVPIKLGPRFPKKQ